MAEPQTSTAHISITMDPYRAPKVPDGQKPATWEDIVTAVAKANGVNPVLALAVGKKESGLNPGAIGDGGKAVGMFQLHPGAAEDTSTDDRSDPIKNITGGVKYLKQLSDRYQGDLSKALMAYNGGASNVDSGSVSPEAQAYAADILASISQQARGAAQAPIGDTPKTSDQTMSPMTSHEAPGEAPSAARSVIRQTGPMTGALVGAYEGAALGAPAGPIGAALGAVAGAGAGAFGGEAISQGIEYLAEKFGFVPSSRPALSERVNRLSAAANTGMMSEMIGRSGITVLTPIAKKVMAPMASRLTQYAREALAMFPPRSRALLPAEVSGSRGLNIAENIAEGSVFGGGRIAATRATRDKMAAARATRIVESIRPGSVSVREAGELAQTDLAAEIKAFRSSERAAWEPFEKAAESIPASTPKLDAFIAQSSSQEAGSILPNAGATAAQRVAELAGELGGAADDVVMIGGSRVPIRQLASSVQDAVISSHGAPPTGMTAAQFSNTVRDLGKLVRSLTKAAETDPSKYNAQLGLAKKLYSLAQQDLRATLSNASSDALRLYEAATGVSREGNQRLFNAAVRKLAKAAPEKIVGMLLKKNNSTAIKATLNAIGPNGRTKVQRAAIDQLIGESPRTNRIEWGAIATKLATLGDDTVSAIFPGGQGEDLKKLAHLMVNIERRPQSAVGRVGIMLTQWGALAGLASGTLTTPSVGVLLTPPLLAKIMASPTGLKWLTTGLEAPLGSAEAIRAAVQLTAFLRQQAAGDAPQPMVSHTQAQPAQ